MKITFRLNTKQTEVDVPADTTLLTLLRDHLNLTGTKCGCEIGECGSCSVILNGKVVNSCLVIAPQVEGCEITTIEGICKANGEPNDLQQAFMEAGAVQCGFCTPGMIMSATALLNQNPSPSVDEIIEGLAGNLCRCTGYRQIIEAVEFAAERRNQAGQQQPTKSEPSKVGM